MCKDRGTGACLERRLRALDVEVGEGEHVAEDPHAIVGDKLARILAQIEQLRHVNRISTYYDGACNHTRLFLSALVCVIIFFLSVLLCMVIGGSPSLALSQCAHTHSVLSSHAPLHALLSQCLSLSLYVPPSVRARCTRSLPPLRALSIKMR
jgi:hypothetical protein